MQWPDWLSTKPSKREDDDTTAQNDDGFPFTSSAVKKESISWMNSLNATDWSQYTSSETLIPTFILTVSTLAAVKLYTSHFRRIRQATYITPDFLHKRSIFGYVTSVGDGDGLRLYHTPGGRLTGWNWLPGRRVSQFKRQELKDETINVRIAGIDAPEMAHFGRPEQPYGREALEALRKLVLGRFVRVRPLHRDQFERVVSTVSVRKWGFFNRDVGLTMLRQGLATVYEAKVFAEFGGHESKYRAAEQKAKDKGVGMWHGQHKGKSGFLGGFFSKKKEVLETPRQYKQRMNALEKEKAEGGKSVQKKT